MTLELRGLRLLNNNVFATAQVFGFPIAEAWNQPDENNNSFHIKKSAQDV